MGLNQIKVELMDHMGSDLSTVNSARVSFAKESEWGGEEPVYDHDGDLMVASTLRLADKDTKLIKYLADHRHMTPFRHNAIQLRCAAPIFLARQLGKHQAGLTWNEVSRRYVDTPPEFFTPDEWRGRPDGGIKQGSSSSRVVYKLTIDGANYPTDEAYDVLTRVSLITYEAMLDAGVAPEMARMVLPQSMMTEWVWTGNLLAFAHIYKERVCPGAQLEAQHFAHHLDLVIRPLFPVSWAALVDNEKE
jgi:thymidylate synthase (FAD)